MCVGHLKYETEFIKGSISKRFNVWRENYSKRFNVRQTICQVPFQSKLAKCPWIIVGANFIMYTKYTKNNRVKVDSVKTSQQILYFVSPLSSKSSLNVDHESTFFLQYPYQYHHHGIRQNLFSQTNMKDNCRHTAQTNMKDNYRHTAQTHMKDKVEQSACFGIACEVAYCTVNFTLKWVSGILHNQQLLHCKLLGYELLW